MAVRAQNKVTPKDFFLDCGSDDATASRPFFIVYSLQTNELDSPDRLPFSLLAPDIRSSPLQIPDSNCGKLY